MKIKNKKIKILVIFIMIIFVMSTSVYAEITTGGSPSEISIIQNAINKIADYAVNASFAAFGTLAAILAAALFLLLEIVFISGGLTYDIALFPLPDAVVFNRIAILDPNFTSPANYSITKAIQSILNSTFLSFQSVAISIFVIAAMVMGIKLALTTIATEKAKYKQAISKWIMGIIVLFLLRYIVAGTFYLNEEIVKSLAATSSTVEFDILDFDNMPYFGAPVGHLIATTQNFIAEHTDFDDLGKVKGYTGLVLKSILEGLGGNFLSAILAFVILGQSIALIISYFKRWFYSILLALVSPLVVAVDTVNKSLGLQSKLLSTWVKEFTITVFIQSIHAAFMVVLLKIIQATYTTASLGYTISGILTIILTAALVKFEKVFKSLLGIRTGMMGEIKGGAASAFKTIHGLRQGVGAVADNAKKMRDAQSKKADADKKIKRLDRKINAANSARAGITDNSTTNTDASYTSNGDTNLYAGGNNMLSNGPILDTEQGSDGTYRPVQVAAGAMSAPGASVSLGGYNGANNGQINIGSQDILANAIANATRRIQSPNERRSLNVNVTNPDEISSGIAQATGITDGTSAGNNVKTKIPTDDEMEDMYDEMAKLQQQRAEAESEYSSARLASIMGTANFVGGLGIGLGAEGDMSDAILTGGYVTKGLDLAAEKAGYKGARKTRKEIYNDTKEKYGEAMDKYKINTEKILQPKSDIVINPMVRAQRGMSSALEVKHMIQGTLTQEMSKEMRNEISKAIRDEMKKESSSMRSRMKANIEDSFKGFKGVASKHNQFKDSYKYMGNKRNSVDNID